ncbi:BRO-like protein [Oceanidesulfovibrio indonesiensis]|uniref:BRO-like protein n=1 Tax=Oceanidesulfovibrio indonesiensis TaxID=54767 RepID=A0A7M3MHS9_9BACT|nr:Bro-N domain-containing protein [Oceanidesulfovibrio indonesiensis]TVM19169.1 BRO-like protein [Oceanidesulfovibrio indonesiensis]
MSNLMPFDFDGNAVRVVLHRAAPWFVAKDVCDVLEHSNNRAALNGLDDDEKGVRIVYTPGGRQEMLCISESGLYALIFASRKPEAKRFRKWVTSEVLPAIRTTGRYDAPGLRLPDDQQRPSLRLKPSLRSQAMRAAVQTAKLSGGAEEDVKRLFEEFCGLFAARPGRPELGSGYPLPGSFGLVEEFAAEELTVMDIDPDRPTPREAKTQAKDLYAMFCAWCQDRGVPKHDVPTHKAFGMALKHLPGVERATPKNKVFYNLVPKS